MVQQRLGGAQRLVEPLDVSHLQLHAPPRGLRDQRIRLGERRGERLLHQHRDAPAQHPHAHLVLELRRHRHRHGAHQAEQFIQVVEARHPHAAATSRARARSVSNTPTSVASGDAARCRA